jgi:hypothetical protein
MSTTGYSGPYDDVTTTTDTTYKFTDLQPETGYFFKVFAYNNSRNGTESVVAVRTRDALPQSPTDFAVVATTLHSVALSWTAPLEDVTGYVVETSEDGTSWDEAGSTDSATTTLTLSGLDPDSHLFIRVHAFNTNGDGIPSSVVYAATVSGKPNPVQNLSAATVGESSVQLVWDDPQPRLDVDLPTTGYLIQSRSVTFTNTGFDATDWEDIQQVGASDHGYLVTQIAPCVNSSGASDGCPQTEYRVLALSEFGQSGNMGNVDLFFSELVYKHFLELFLKVVIFLYNMA